MILTKQQLSFIKDALESVTNQYYKQELDQDTDDTLLCAFRNDTHVDYLIHIIRLSYNSYQVCLAQQRWRNIITRYDHALSPVEMDRFFSDPRQFICYWIGQILDT